MKNTLQFPAARFQHGVVLLEAMISILIFSIGILGAVGLQATVIKNTSDAKYRAEASNLVQQRIGAIWVADTAALGALGEAEPGTDISAMSGLPNGKRVTLRSDPADPLCAADLLCFSVKVTWQQPGADVHNVKTVARVQ